MKPSDIQNAEYINKHAKQGDIYEDKNRQQWRCAIVPGTEYGLENDVMVWETPSLDLVYELEASAEPYSFVRNEPPAREAARPSVFKDQ